MRRYGDLRPSLRGRRARWPAAICRQPPARLTRVGSGLQPDLTATVALASHPAGLLLRDGILTRGPDPAVLAAIRTRVLDIPLGTMGIPAPPIEKECRCGKWPPAVSRKPQAVGLRTSKYLTRADRCLSYFQC